MSSLAVGLAVVGYLALCVFTAGWRQRREEEIIEKSALGEERKHQEKMARAWIITLGFILAPAMAFHGKVTDFKKYREMISGAEAMADK